MDPSNGRQVPDRGRHRDHRPEQGGEQRRPGARQPGGGCCAAARLGWLPALGRLRGRWKPGRSRRRPERECSSELGCWGAGRGPGLR
ncbi:MAG: hypothetical protein E6J39_07490 [Chloroflexi bacterium]|nr:MAG: hypothetical protein E6J39_07490 [Chloroflexota bacterium]